MRKYQALIHPVILAGIIWILPAQSDAPQYLILTTSELADAGEIIAVLHQDEVPADKRLITQVVAVDTLLTENGGIESGEDLRQYILSQLNENPDLEYLLLIGDEYMLPPIYNDYDFPSDDFYSSQYPLGAYPQISTGRIPVSNPEDALAVAEKIRTYTLTPPAGSWKSKLMLIADDAQKPGGSNYMTEVTHVANSNTLYFQTKEYLDISCFYGTEYEPFYGGGIPTLPDMTEDVLNEINSGVAWLNYIGHGNETTLADEMILDMERDINFISPPDGKLPIWVVGSCDLGHYDNADCFAENLLIKPDGAIALITTTRLILSQSVYYYLIRLYDHLASYLAGDADFRLGDLVKLSKAGGADYVFQLFGDPAMSLILPVTSEILDNVPDTLQVLNSHTVELSTAYYNNDSYISVRGPEKPIHQVYGGWVDLYYWLPGDNVYSADFTGETEFVISLDYPVCDDCPASIRVFSESGSDPRLSYSQLRDSLMVFPPEDIADNLPPQIVMVANSDTLNPGQTLLPPYNFTVHISDSSGINLMGNTGHHITYRVDDSPEISLTGEFQYESGSGSSGWVSISIDPALTGIHDVTVVAWDNANNRGELSLPLCFSSCETIPETGGDDWSSITSMLIPTDMTGGGGYVYITTAGGLLIWQRDSYDFQQLASGSDMVKANLTAIDRDMFGNLWLGSGGSSGALQIYSPQLGLLSLLTLDFSEIDRIVTDAHGGFAIGNINNQQVIVEFRFSSEMLPYYQNYYSQFPLPSDEIRDIDLSDTQIFVSLPSGVVQADYMQDILSVENDWTAIYEGSDIRQFIAGIPSMVVDGSTLMIQSDNGWDAVFSGFTGEVIRAEYDTDSAVLSVLTTSRFYRFDSNFQLMTGYPVISVSGNFTSFYADDQEVIIGRSGGGILRFNPNIPEPELYVPDTPFINEVQAVTVDDLGRIAGVNRKGMFLVDADHSVNLVSQIYADAYPLNSGSGFSGAELPYYPGSNLPWSIVSAEDGSFFFSNSGIRPSQPGLKGGVIRVYPEDAQCTVYDTTGGVLDGLNGIYNPNWTNRYLTIHQIKKDPAGNLWVVNPYSEVYNHIAAIYMTQEDEWVHITAPDTVSYLPQEVAFDGQNRAWFGMKYDIPMNNQLLEYARGGLRTVDFGGTYFDQSDDEWLGFDNMDILPSESVWSLDFDDQGRLWVITSGGIQGYEITVTNDTIHLTPVASSPFLSHIPFYKGDHIRSDGNGNKWVVTRHSGVFVILADNTLWPDVNGLNPENSGLLSHIVYDVDFNTSSHSAVFATANGISILDLTSVPETQIQTLPGDMNNDESVDVNDVVVMVFYILQLPIPIEVTIEAGDMNNDGIIDVADVVAVVDIILSQSNRLNIPDLSVQLLRDSGNMIFHSSSPVRGIYLELSQALPDMAANSFPAGWRVYSNGRKIIGLNFNPDDSFNELALTDFPDDTEITYWKICAGSELCVSSTDVPEKFRINRVYPNPFNPVVHIEIESVSDDIIEVVIYDIKGRFVDKLYGGKLKTGFHTFSWDGEGVSSGIYFIKVQSGEKRFVQKVTLLK